MKHRLEIKGFTAVELFITLLVVGIFLAIAVPSYSAFIENNAIRTASQDLFASLTYARSEAVKRNVMVSVCATSDRNYNSCGSNWQMGWIVFVNPTGGNTLTTPLRIVEVTNPNVTVTVTPTRNIITYQGSGFSTSTTGALTMVLKSSGCTSNAGRRLSLTLTGIPSLSAVTCP